MTADDKRWRKAECLKVFRVGTTATYRTHGYEWTAGTKAEYNTPFIVSFVQNLIPTVEPQSG